MTTPQVGQIWDNYRLRRFIAKGGFGWVFEAEHKWLKSQVAIKILDTDPYRLQKDIGQFLDEAQKLQALKHPHIVEVKDFCIAHEMPYLVMPLYQQSLSSTRGHILPLATVVTYVQQIAEALSYVHQHEIVHRDIKPENFLLGKDGEIVLSDFGIAVVTHTVQLGEQKLSGIPYYVPPEQWQRKAVRASDQYALAVVVYQWLCGELPFRGSPVEIMGQHFHTQPPSLCERNTSIAEDVEEVVMKALAKDPAQRFQTILEFAEALKMAAKQYSFKLLPKVPVEEKIGVQIVDWVWGNHYLLLAYEDKRVKIIDVLTGQIVFSGKHDIDDYEIRVVWDKENCTESFPEGTITLVKGGHIRIYDDVPFDYGTYLVDMRTGKPIGAFERGTFFINDEDRRIDKSFHLEGKKLLNLVRPLNQLDPESMEHMLWIGSELGGLSLYHRMRIKGIYYCPPQWQYVLVRGQRNESLPSDKPIRLTKKVRSCKLTSMLVSMSFLRHISAQVANLLCQVYIISPILYISASRSLMRSEEQGTAC